jgi:hypothetical protein
LIAQAGMVLFMVRKRLFEELPIFFGYTLFQVLRAVLLLLARSSGPNVYAYSYWIAEGISAIIGFFVINEVFSKVLARYEGIRYIARVLFRWSFAILIVLAFVAAISNPAEKTPGLIAAVLTLERSIRIVQCGLILFLFIFSSALSVSWRNSVFGIAFGFGIYAAVELIIVSTRIHAGGAMDTAFVYLKPGAYAVAIIVWCTYLLLPAPVPIRANEGGAEFISDWNAAILGMLKQ